MTDEEAVEFLVALLNVESVTGDEADAVDFVVARMRELGLRADVDDAGNGIGQIGASDQAELMFLGHIDTVPGVVPVRLQGSKVYGRGAVDAKGPLAAAVVAAVRATSASCIKIVAAVGEEGDSRGAQFLLRSTRPDALIVGEPGSADSVVLGYKGSLHGDMAICRDAGHSAGPGPSAADQAFEAWTRVRQACRHAGGEHRPDDTRGRDNPPEREPTGAFDEMTPTLLSMSAGSDGMAQFAQLRMGFRLPPGITLPDAQVLIARAAQPADIAFQPGVPAFVAPRRSLLVTVFNRAIRDEDLVPRVKNKTGTSDMNLVAPEWHCPVVAYGPGDSSLDHTPNEHIEVDEYLRGIRVLTRVFETWGPVA